MSEDEISLREIFLTLLASKKIILLVTIISLFISSAIVINNEDTYKTSVMIEIGHFDSFSGTEFYTQKLIESPQDLALYLNSAFKYKSLPQSDLLNFNNLESLRFDPIMSKLLYIELISSSEKTAKEFMNQIIDNILARHGKLKYKNEVLFIDIIERGIL